MMGRHFAGHEDYFLDDAINIQFGHPDFVANPTINGDGHVRISLVYAPTPPTEEFNFTGSVQTFTVPRTGRYRLQVWGASGNNGSTVPGALGGYSTGEVNLVQGDILYIYVGGQPTGVQGGFNGGGHGSTNLASTANGGGGASDIRINTDSLHARAIVAGRWPVEAGVKLTYHLCQVWEEDLMEAMDQERLKRFGMVLEGHKLRQELHRKLINGDQQVLAMEEMLQVL